MALVISINSQYHRATVTTGYAPIIADSPESLAEIVKKSDWSPIIFRDGKRSTAHFVEATTLALDIDNTGENVMSIDLFRKVFCNIEHYILTSKSHQKEKISNKITHSPADRYHVCFPLSRPITTPGDYREAMEKLISMYPAIDAGAKDGARFFYGFDQTEIFHTPGQHLDFDKLPKFTATKTPSRLSAMAQPDQFSDDDLMDKTKGILRDAAKSGAFDDRVVWLECGMAFKGSGLTFEDWMSISWDSEKTAWAENQKRWDGFRADRHTKGTLVHYARQFSPGFLVSRTASENYDPTHSTPQEKAASLQLSMPHSKWFQPHLITDYKKDPLTGQLKEVYKPLATIANLEKMLAFYGVKISENLMKHEVETVIPSVIKSEGKHENASFAEILSISVLNKFPTEKLKDYLVQIAHKNAFHPVKLWLNQLPEWDGQDRIGDILRDVIKLDYTKTTASFSRLLLKKWLVSCVAAVLEVRYRGRGVLTFQGAQEIGKTAFFRSILPKEHYGEWFKDGLHVDPKDRDSIYKSVSRWIVELGEVEGIFQKEISALKAFLTSDEDVLRLPYEAKTETYNRRTIYCATANDGAFLNDPTGSSRFWVLPVLSVDYMHDLDVVQLWSQCLELYKTGCIWWLEGGEQEALTLSNQGFTEIDAYQEMIRLNFDMSDISLESGRKTMMSATEIAITCGCKMQGHKDSRGIAKALRSMNIKPGFLANRSQGFFMPQKLAVAIQQPSHYYQRGDL